MIVGSGWTYGKIKCLISLRRSGMNKRIHLVCNAHLDPVWLWQRSEGMAEAISTFRIAADFCEKYDGFVFNHNESVLYEWVMENEPELFERIQRLVKEGKWRIMGGWYLQPDVIMPCGESIIRQIRVGNEFFKKYFGDIPKTAISFDAFGHSRGLVQILKKCGYDNYVYLRPRDKECGPFIWKGFDGSSVNAFKLYEWYNTPKGEALERVKSCIRDFPERSLDLVTWGIGNHGGGPSEKDLNDINNFAEERGDIDFVHSDPDSYFNELDKQELEAVSSSLMPCMVGCYTSMVRIKQGHRNLENRLNMCEKMLYQSGISYDERELAEAEKALLFTEFHDILPGTMVKKSEADSLRLIGCGDEIVDRLIARSFFKLCSGQPKAKENEIPVLVYNPHPYPVEADFEAEFQLAEQNHPSNGIYEVIVYDEDGSELLCQNEKEDSSHGMDWRKKTVFHAVAKPMGVTRFDCKLRLVKDYVRTKPYTETNEHIILKNDAAEVYINKATGLVDRYTADGKEMLAEGGIRLKAFRDNEDPWGMTVDSFQEAAGEFRLLSDEDARKFRGDTGHDKSNVLVTENGDLRTKVQAIFGYRRSYAVVTYTVSKKNKYLDINVKMLANDVNTMFKLCFDTALKDDAKAYVQTMFGTEQAEKDGREAAFQKWCGLHDDINSFDVINAGTYGGSFNGNEIQISLLRTAVYSAHPVDGVQLAPKDRMYEHIDMGERDFKFRVCADTSFTDYEAEIFNQKPYILSFFPSGAGERPQKGVEIDNRYILLSTLRKNGNGIMIRLYNASDSVQKCGVDFADMEMQTELAPFEVKTFVKNGTQIMETGMLGDLRGTVDFSAER